MILAFLAALALHAAMLAGLLAWHDDVVVVEPPGEQEISIDLAPQMFSAPTLRPAENAMPAGAPAEATPVAASETATARPEAVAELPEVVTAAPVPPPPVADTKPIEEVPAKPEPIPAQTVPPPTPASASAAAPVPPQVRPIESRVVEALPLPQETVAAELPKATPPATAKPTARSSAPALRKAPTTSQPVPRPRPVARPPSRVVAEPVATTHPLARPKRRVRQADRSPDDTDAASGAEPRAQAHPANRSGEAGRSERRTRRGASSRENTGGAAAAADPNALNRYAAELAAALRARLRYPGGGGSGTAVLRFTLNRSGRVLSSRIVRSAGDPALDEAALATASPGSSLPPAPEGVPQQTLTISVPLQFNGR